MKVKPGKLFVKLSLSQLPGVGTFYKGTLPDHPCITIEDLADRAVSHRTSYRPETLISSYRIMGEEIYNAIEQGFNVDFDFGRTEIDIIGRFNTPLEPFDYKRHAIRINLRPSPRLNQLAASFPVEVKGFYPNAPLPNEVSIHQDAYSQQEDREFCQIPASPLRPLFIHGRRMKVMGDLPDVGLYLINQATGTRYFIAPKMIFINESQRLCFLPPAPLEVGKWSIEIHSQYTPTYHLYKRARIGVVSFTVVDATSPG